MCDRGDIVRIALCDDLQSDLDSAAELILAWARERKVEIELFTFENGDKLLEAALQHRFDAIFLDIVMPLLNGMDTARELRNNGVSVPLIFLTSSPEFALESYEVKAYNYLLKPIAPEKLASVLDECAELIYSEPKSVVIKTAFGWQKLHFGSIEFVEAQNKKTVFYLKDTTQVETTEPLHVFEKKLLVDDGFFKCHRSYVVFLQNVDRFDNSCLVTKSGQRVPIARGCSKAFKEAYFNQLFKK